MILTMNVSINKFVLNTHTLIHSGRFEGDDEMHPPTTVEIFINNRQ